MKRIPHMNRIRESVREGSVSLFGEHIPRAFATNYPFRTKPKLYYQRRFIMATSQKVHLDPQDTGLWKVKQTAEAANKAAELLQDDLKVSLFP